jgi:DNA-binding LacI/PurR family transcriptional regulator
VIALLMPVAPDMLFTDTHLLGVMQGINEEAALHAYHVLLSAPDSNDGLMVTCNRLLKEQRVAGIIVEGELSEGGARLQLETGYPVVVVGYSEMDLVPQVRPDDEGGAYGLTQHLLALDHRRIGIIAGPAHPAMQARWRGVERAIRDVGLDGSSASLVRADCTAQGGYQAAAELLQAATPPTAVIAFTGRIALGALEWLREHKYAIPGDISIACFDDVHNVELFSVPLTTVRLFSAEIGRRAAALLFNLIDGNIPTGAEVVLPSRLVARCSTTFAHSKSEYDRQNQARGEGPVNADPVKPQN